ncbi:MAG: hypothetical protein K8T91_00900 [Planctomycetes bacterium]|nr:hypothetical protein [Planctomycetota bacterium]
MRTIPAVCQHRLALKLLLVAKTPWDCTSFNGLCVTTSTAAIFPGSMNTTWFNYSLCIVVVLSGSVSIGASSGESGVLHWTVVRNCSTHMRSCVGSFAAENEAQEFRRSVSKSPKQFCLSRTKNDDRGSTSFIFNSLAQIRPDSCSFAAMGAVLLSCTKHRASSYTIVAIEYRSN